MTELNDVLARFHGALVEEILARRPEYLHAPFTVAEIYQNLVPYGTHRDQIGVEMNADYEDALLRLLAGDGSYLVLESEAALRALREELESSSPNTGMYREFAAVDVRLNPVRVSGGGSAPRGETEPSESVPVSMAELAPAVEMAPSRAAPSNPVVPMPAGTSARSITEEIREAPSDCRWCRAELPQRSNLNFCPFCGTDVHVVPCPGCGEELDPEWRFCVACGTEVGG